MDFDVITDNDFGITANTFLDENNLLRKNRTTHDEQPNLRRALMLAYVGSNPDLNYYEYVAELARLKLNMSIGVNGGVKDVLTAYRSLMSAKLNRDKRREKEDD